VNSIGLSDRVFSLKPHDIGLPAETTDAKQAESAAVASEKPDAANSPKSTARNQLNVRHVRPAYSCVMLRRTMTDQGDPAAPHPAPFDRVEDERRSAPPQVYRAADADHWIVEPPYNAAPDEGPMVFTGSMAQHLALTYAHEKFGNARFFPY
jgi:hypothetical protein